MTELDSFRGAALLQRGTEDLLAIARGTTGTYPDTDCTLGTRFQIASVSKQFTAAALLLLVDRGVLSVDDAVHRWLDGCPASWNSITVHHLLTHTAGLVHWRHIPDLDLTAPIAAEEELRIFQGAPLLSAPGERYSYSSPGYVLIAHIVERAADQPYASRQAMFTVHAPVDDDDGLVRTKGYGYGWCIGSVSGEHRVIYHPGDNAGFLAANAWFPDDAIRLAVFSNEETTDLQAIIHQVITTAFPRSAA